MKTKTHRVSRPPTPEEIRQRAAVALATMQIPNYDDIDEDSVFKAFYSVFDGETVNETWMNGFKAQISRLSHGDVKLVEGKKIRMNVLGPAAYMELIKGKEHQRVVIGPYEKPIVFVSKIWFPI